MFVNFFFLLKIPLLGLRVPQFPIFLIINKKRNWSHVLPPLNSICCNNEGNSLTKEKLPKLERFGAAKYWDINAKRIFAANRTKIPPNSNGYDSALQRAPSKSHFSWCHAQKGAFLGDVYLLRTIYVSVRTLDYELPPIVAGRWTLVLKCSQSPRSGDEVNSWNQNWGSQIGMEA